MIYQVVRLLEGAKKKRLQVQVGSHGDLCYTLTADMARSSSRK